jgi:proline iminopeptidase
VASRSPSPAADEGYFSTTDGLHLFYRSVGSGPDTVVVVHGFQGHDQNYLAPDLQPLAHDRTLLFYDQRGEGRSDAVSDPNRLGIDDHVRDLDALRQHFHLSRLTLLGHSGGALIATRYAEEHPERVARMVLVAPPPLVDGKRFGEEAGRTFYARLDSASWARARALQASLATRLDPVEGCRELIAFTLPAAFFSDPRNVLRMRGDFCAAPPEKIRTSAERLAAFRASVADRSFGSGLSSLRMPILVMHGEHDAIPVAASRALVAALPNAELVTIPDADHLPWVERPEEFFTAVTRFLQQKRPLP